MSEYISVFNQFLKKEQSFFYGRKSELKLLKDYFETPRPLGWHIGIHGGRRTGKTTLINHFIEQYAREGDFVFTLTGNRFHNLHDAVEVAVQRFKIAIEKTDELLKRGWEDYSGFKNKWIGFFEFVIANLSEIHRSQPETRFFLFFDELDWFPNNKEFVSGYSNLINQCVFSMDYLMSFVASSSNSWMKSQIFHDVYGLHRRLQKIKLLPFSFKEIIDFFERMNWNLKEYQIFEYFQMFGGYLKHYIETKDWINFNQPLESNFSNLSKITDYVNNECKDVFRNIFDEKKQHFLYSDVICRLRHCSAIELREYIIKHQSLLRVGNRTDAETLVLNELVDAGILEYTLKGNRRLYYCSMPILFFYFFFLNHVEDLSIKDCKIELDKIQNWRGASFELMALIHLPEILDFFGIKQKHSKLNYKVVEGEKCKAQIDLFCHEDFKLKNHCKVHIFELKCREANNIDERDYSALINREEQLYNHLQSLYPKKKIQIIPRFLALTEDKRRMKYSLPEICSSKK